ncbi:uncharacterized protein N7500_004379, partial [Penicillium coprophilum]|uniref:uncharacterized protein n=1 Tax=Penicillium coprophilum TaxID=36646 RepID=UPI002395A7A5
MSVISCLIQIGPPARQACEFTESGPWMGFLSFNSPQCLPQAPFSQLLGPKALSPSSFRRVNSRYFCRLAGSSKLLPRTLAESSGVVDSSRVPRILIFKEFQSSATNSQTATTRRQPEYSSSRFDLSQLKLISNGLA